MTALVTALFIVHVLLPSCPPKRSSEEFVYFVRKCALMKFCVECGQKRQKIRYLRMKSVFIFLWRIMTYCCIINEKL